MAVVVALWVRHEERRTSRIDARLAAERAARVHADDVLQRPRELDARHVVVGVDAELARAEGVLGVARRVVATKATLLVKEAEAYQLAETRGLGV